MPKFLVVEHYMFTRTTTIDTENAACAEVETSENPENFKWHEGEHRLDEQLVYEIGE